MDHPKDQPLCLVLDSQGDVNIVTIRASLIRSGCSRGDHRKDDDQLSSASLIFILQGSNHRNAVKVDIQNNNHLN